MKHPTARIVHDYSDGFLHSVDPGGSWLAHTRDMLVILRATEGVWVPAALAKAPPLTISPLQSGWHPNVER